jgi:hypothetical protein
MSTRLIRRPAFLAAAAVILAAAAFAAYWFAPWNLVVDRTVDEALPSTAPAEPVDDGAGDAPAGGDAGTDDGSPATLSRGRFQSLEHATRGSALVVELADGSRLVRLEGLETSNGPDLRVILSSEAPQDDWHVYDDGELLDLGALKGNLGSSNYEIPADADLSDFESIVVWCRRFSVGFGVAPLELVVT